MIIKIRWLGNQLLNLIEHIPYLMQRKPVLSTIFLIMLFLVGTLSNPLLQDFPGIMDLELELNNKKDSGVKNITSQSFGKILKVNFKRCY